ncbi:MAG: hypothetical protein HeimC2_10810 [Candidatus Heimdallarchaeota archaeon LC_2]|nr:MAG: hypothetical protein HeimC2_10810 [Candidatus Heimdallarchaeota archaeon LC_2]
MKSIDEESPQKTAMTEKEDLLRAFVEAFYDSKQIASKSGELEEEMA